MKHDTDERVFKAMDENGKCFSFSLHSGATNDDAWKFAKEYYIVAGCKDRIVKVWEPCV